MQGESVLKRFGNYHLTSAHLGAPEVIRVPPLRPNQAASSDAKLSDEELARREQLGLLVMIAHEGNPRPPSRDVPSQ